MIDSKHIKNAIKRFTYPYGNVYCFNNYVIGMIKEGELIDKPKAMQILSDLDTFFKNNPYVFISNRTLKYEIDITVYNLVDANKLIGIAIVSPEPKEIQRALKEQSQYKGSFGLFKNLESAIAWACTFKILT